ncbi:MAG: CHRD domain-containing protein, partial [Thermoanaerobaculia bacterium]
MLLVLATPAAGQLFVFHLRGDQEVPPVASPHSGGCHGELDQVAGQLDLTCAHDVTDATIMHIHRAPAGANGPIVFDLGDPASPVQATWTGMTPADIADLLAGDLYINIHTAGRPDGEIRGQILPRTVDAVAFTADGGQMVPPNGSPATASCSADLNDPATALFVQCTHDVPVPASAHLHEAPARENGPLAFTFPSPDSPFSANVPMMPLLVAEFAATFLYVEIHGQPPAAEGDPVSDIRGQIGTPPPAPLTGTIRISKQTFPPGGAGFGFTDNVPGGPAAFALDHGQTQVFAGVGTGVYTVTEDDPGTTPGGYALGDLDCDDADSTADPFTRTATIDLDAGEVVTCRFENFQTPSGDETFIFHLSGDQEVPPVASPATGGCYGELDSAAGELVLVCVHNVTGPTLMHIHRAPAGANGPIVFNLGDPTSPVQATWSGMTPADVADLLAGNLYVNIHTAGRPEGEIRGQILERTVDTVAFTADGAQMVPPNSTTATASCLADLNAAATELAVECTHDLAPADVAHVHEGPPGINGPLVFTFAAAASPIAGDVPMSPRLLADFAAGFLYVEIHGPDPGDESAAAAAIRGRIGEPPPVPTTGTIRIVKQTFPAGGTGFAFTDDIPGGPGTFSLDDGETQVLANVGPGTWTVTELDPAATPGGFTLAEVTCGDDDSTGDPFARTATVRLAAGEAVTCAVRNFESAPGGQVFVFHLAGEQEVPPVPSPASGGCFARFDAGAGELAILCVHVVAGATIMHIHRGAAGVNGPIVFDLGDPTSPVQATWTGMTAADVADLLAGDLYV